MARAGEAAGSSSSYSLTMTNGYNYLILISCVIYFAGREKNRPRAAQIKNAVFTQIYGGAIFHPYFHMQIRLNGNLMKTIDSRRNNNY